MNVKQYHWGNDHDSSSDHTPSPGCPQCTAYDGGTKLLCWPTKRPTSVGTI